MYIAAANGREDIVDLMASLGADVNRGDKVPATDRQCTRVVVGSQYVRSCETRMAGRAVLAARWGRHRYSSPVNTATMPSSACCCPWAQMSIALLRYVDCEQWLPRYPVVPCMIMKYRVDVLQNEWTPLFAAAEAGHASTLKLLIEKKAHVGHTDMVRAVYRSWFPQLSRAFHETCVLVTFQEGWTPLHLACQSCHDDVVRLLVAAGAAVDQRDEVPHSQVDMRSCWLPG